MLNICLLWLDHSRPLNIELHRLRHPGQLRRLLHHDPCPGDDRPDGVERRALVPPVIVGVGGVHDQDEGGSVVVELDLDIVARIQGVPVLG